MLFYSPQLFRFVKKRDREIEGHRDRGTQGLGDKTTLLMHRFRGFSEVYLWIDRSALEDFLKRICGLTEPLLWIQLVAEGSLSQRRALGVSITSARRVNVESSTFQ